MDVIAHELKNFQQADIPVLWRPFHEADDNWFWWGAKEFRIDEQYNTRECLKKMYNSSYAKTQNKRTL